jgi:hypothetical protein
MAASVTVDVTVLGIKDALKQINSIDPKLRRAITKEYKSIVAPIVKSAQDAYPELPPMSGWSRAYKSLGAWDAGKVKKGVQAKVNTRKARNRNLAKGADYETIGTFIVYQKTGWGSIFDMAGRKTSSPMVEVLNARYGNASRSMWPAYEQNKEQVDQEMQGLVKQVMHEVDRYL